MSQSNPFDTSRRLEPPPQVPGVVTVESSSLHDNSTACAMAPSSHQPQLSGNNGGSSGENGTRENDWISDQELIDLELEIDTPRMQEENTPVTMNGSSIEDAEEEAILSQELQQTIATGVSLGLQSVKQFLADWANQFSQHGLVAKVAQLEEALKSANQENERLGGEYQKLHLKYNTANSKLKEANTKLNKALHERDEQRRLGEWGSLANPTKATDDVVLGKWKILDYNIRALACSLAKNPPILPLDEIADTRLGWIWGSFRKFLHDEEYREFMLRAYLWAIVKDMVFDAGDEVWGGPAVAELKNIQDQILNRIGQEHPLDHQPTCQQAAKWFAQGSNLLSHLWGNSPDAVRILATEETRRLRSFFPAQHESFDRTDKKVWEEIRAIIECAVELDQIFMSSKAIFQVHWKDESQKPAIRLRFNSEAMNVVGHDRDLSPKSKVIMTTSPFLYKLGNADGQNYDRRMLLAKASVVCN